MQHVADSECDRDGDPKCPPGKPDPGRQADREQDADQHGRYSLRCVAQRLVNADLHDQQSGEGRKYGVRRARQLQRNYVREDRGAGEPHDGHSSGLRPVPRDGQALRGTLRSGSGGPAEPLCLMPAQHRPGQRRVSSLVSFIKLRGAGLGSAAAVAIVPAAPAPGIPEVGSAGRSPWTPAELAALTVCGSRRLGSLGSARTTEAAVTSVRDPHLMLVRPVAPLTPEGCAECLELGTRWVHLRLCLTCGHIGCCDSSPMRHARGHAMAIGHPIVQSFEPGEDWRWCYVDQSYV
jgi:Zn-finger in ubiquitin-hydrolases and other protein